MRARARRAECGAEHGGGWGARCQKLRPRVFSFPKRYKAAEKAMLADALAQADVVITTALIPGRPAPRLVTAEHLGAMPRGAVLVDMAAVNGGNVEGARVGEVVAAPTNDGVRIIGYSDLPSRLPMTASNLCANRARDRSRGTSSRI